VTALIPEVIGTNLFDINKKIVEDTIAEELDWVKDAELSKIFPDKLVIKLVERKPDLIIFYKDEYFLIDDEGVILDKIEIGNLDVFGDLILVKNAVSYRINIGEKIAKKNVLSCADIYKAMDSQMRSMIKEARIEDNVSGDIVFETYDGREIIFGSGNEVIKKIEILKQLLKEETDYTIIDLRSWENPVVKQ
jgi:cell division protein FtsQ